MTFWENFWSIFRLRYVLIPFSVQQLALGTASAYIGVKEYRIFGVRFMRVQQTQPWK